MPWQARSIVSQREEFVVLCGAPGAKVSRLCERFRISRQTGHLWIKRFAADGRAGLVDQSRRPVTSPGKSGEEVERLIVSLRRRHPAWGGRKLKARLEQVGHANIPAASTVTAILRRHGLITPEASEAAAPWTRFEHEHPNDLWQMDFKGPIATRRGVCHALTVLDDHSRFSVGLRACPDQRMPTVRGHLTRMFEVYGLPWRILADNGPPWGFDGAGTWTHLGVWLLKLGVVMIHGRPYHPQTQGKEERFHRTLNAELLRRADLRGIAHAQALMDPWRDVYNLERPHEAVGMKPPVARYRPSSRAMPTRPAGYEPSPDQTPQVVKEGGRVRFAGRSWYLGLAWNHETVGLRWSERDGVAEVYFGPYRIAELDVRTPDPGERVRLVPVGRYAPSLHEPHAKGYPHDSQGCPRTPSTMSPA